MFMWARSGGVVWCWSELHLRGEDFVTGAGIAIGWHKVLYTMTIATGSVRHLSYRLTPFAMVRLAISARSLIKRI